MTVLLAGASGFIGRNLAVALTDRQVIAINASGVQVPGCTSTFAIDRLRDIGALPADAVVINLAATRYDPARFAFAQADTLAHNTVIADTLYRFCAERGLREMRLASSVAVYPAALAEMDDAVPLDLNAPPHAGEAFYAWSKRHAEILAGLYRDRFGISTVTFRLSNPYGPHDSLRPEQAHVAPAFVMKALDPGPVFPIRGDAEVERDFVFVGDVVALFRRTLDWRGRSDAFNLATGQSTTLRRLAETVLRLAGACKTITPGAPGAFGPAARRVKADRIKAEFAHVFTTLEDGLRPTLDWYRHAYAP